MVSRGQLLRAGIDGQTVDIDNQAIEAAMRMRGVKDQWDCLLRVRAVFHHFLSEKGKTDGAS